MTWDIEYTDEFGRWWNTLTEAEQVSLAASVQFLLIGGDKTADERWYEVNIPVADRLYDERLDELRKEGLING
ncbi:uncharacterized protein conserved in bacteria [Serpentinimonas maccroryi]|uniref:Uncharacterized protein conserved in bacteria n=1 Tax=Serpentinimonas maccroryi TaxID=1458426 RepID=A0A060NYT8_9BURK|nr:hypothetical protein [Serpentinimonas maccroryi]MBA4253120.1 hypothetical protein [Comamonadaceae bacterium]BAO84054.1 uncharacterized protein conserved in bacteria [Serpentinimonas maccroryi]